MDIVFRFKIWFEEYDEIERYIDIRANQSFSDFYRCILASVKFKPESDIRFFLSGDSWRYGKELGKIDSKNEKDFATIFLNKYVVDPHQRMVLEILGEKEWELRIEMVKIYKNTDTSLVLPYCSKEVGIAPKQNNIRKIGQPTNEFETMVDELMEEDKPKDIDSMGLDQDFSI